MKTNIMLPYFLQIFGIFCFINLHCNNQVFQLHSESGLSINMIFSFLLNHKVSESKSIISCLLIKLFGRKL